MHFDVQRYSTMGYPIMQKKDYFAILQQPVRADVRRVYFLQQTPYPDLLPITLSFFLF